MIFKKKNLIYSNQISTCTKSNVEYGHKYQSKFKVAEIGNMVYIQCLYIYMFIYSVYTYIHIYIVFIHIYIYIYI